MQANSNVEFMKLWSEYAPRVYGYICSLTSNCSDADDIFQETSIFLFENFAEFEAGTSFSAWACRVAHLKTLAALRQNRLLEHVDEGFLEVLSEAALRATERSDQRKEALADCLKKLPARDRRLVELRYERGSNVKTIAETMRSSDSLVYKSLARIHDWLLKCIRRQVGEANP